MEFWDVLWQILTVLAILPRFIGLLVFGLGAGWLALHIFSHHEHSWQVAAVLLVCFFGLAGAMLNFMPPGALGAYTLGAGAALLYWGLRKPDDEDASKKKK
ncbi:MAG: hypothetical protein HYZ26_05740 [Chloroflexi bacterium]|nr:hypothetical protein [Chloroflexota bacterium]